MGKDRLLFRHPLAERGVDGPPAGDIVIDLAHDPFVCVLMVTGPDEGGAPREVCFTLGTDALAGLARVFTQATARAVRADMEALEEVWGGREPPG